MNDKCRYCKEHVEDGFHVLCHCKHIPGLEDFEDVRKKFEAETRKEWCDFLFSRDDEVKKVRRKLLDLCLENGIEI